MKVPVFTPAEATVVRDILWSTWIPRGREDEFKSALEKLEVLSRMPEEHPYSNRGSDCGK